MKLDTAHTKNTIKILRSESIKKSCTHRVKNGVCSCVYLSKLADLIEEGRGKL